MVNFISLFAGCGGSSLGYKLAGYNELLAIDFNNNVIETFKLNFSEVPIWNKDITKISGKEILKFCNLKKGELDLLDGSPPCQGFSTAGKRNISDNRNDLIKHFIRLVNEIQPKVYIMENVSGMVKGKMKGVFKEYMIEMKKQNYNVSCKMLNACHYSVPQSRQRLIWIGIRKDLNKIPTYPEYHDKIITVEEAFKDIKDNDMPPPVSKFMKEYIPLMKCGQTLNDVGYKGGFQTMRIYLNKPAPTLTKIIGGIGYGHNIHPTEDRVLSINELKRLQTLPDEFKLIGTYQEKVARIGNSVPPLMMKAIAEQIKKTVFEV